MGYHHPLPVDTPSHRACKGRVKQRLGCKQFAGLLITKAGENLVGLSYRGSELNDVIVGVCFFRVVLRGHTDPRRAGKRFNCQVESSSGPSITPALRWR